MRCGFPYDSSLDISDPTNPQKVVFLELQTFQTWAKFSELASMSIKEKNIHDLMPTRIKSCNFFLLSAYYVGPIFL